MKKTLFVCSCALLLVGCQTDPESAKTTQQPQFGQPESSIPWNRPEDWEQGGQLGSMLPSGLNGQR